MKYYLIVGEASGDLHASRLMGALKRLDPSAEFRFYGGDQMVEEGGELAQHYKALAYMGFMPVVLHLRTILRARRECKEDIVHWQPDAVILVDYADFNLNIAQFVKTTNRFASHRPKVYFYISPKLWAWKEGRIKLFRRYVDELFCILPFEKDFFEGKHNYPVHYVGNPTASEVKDFKAGYSASREAFCKKYGLDDRPIIALLAGSRRQELKDSLPMMRRVAQREKDYQFVVAAVKSIDSVFYDKFLKGTHIYKVVGATYELLSHAEAALVTSGTATLETACFNVPQVVMYKTILPRVTRWVWDNFFGVKYISLVNLIADKEVVAEMFAEKFTLEQIVAELEKLLHDGAERTRMLADYSLVQSKLGDDLAPDNAARLMKELLT